MINLENDFKNSKVKEIDIYKYEEKVINIHRRLKNSEMDFTGWVNYPIFDHSELLDEIIEVSKQIRAKTSSLVIIGIGGSYLGAKSAFEMLLKPFHNERADVKIYFAGFNMSGAYHKALYERVYNEDVSVITVSKSGNTTETKSAFTLFKNLLKEKYGEKYNERIYVVSETESNMHKECVENNYSFFEMDKNIGGRYSVLTAAGLLPICAMGIDIKAIMSGAKQAYIDYDDENIKTNLCYQYAAIRRELNSSGKTTEVYAFYEPACEYFAQWLIQLYGESEGKNKKGLYPSFAILTRDLHSMGQFLQDGSKMFFETIIDFRNHEDDISYEENAPSYNEFNKIIAKAVNKAHCENPIINLNFNKLDAYSFGYMVYFFEKACAMSCMMFDENPFNQPGVEVYKQNVREML